MLVFVTTSCANSLRTEPKKINLERGVASEPANIYLSGDKVDKDETVALQALDNKTAELGSVNNSV